MAVAWYLEDEGTDFTDSLLHTIPKLEIWVPALWMLEFSNALFAAVRRRRISPSERAQIVGQTSLHSLNLPFPVHPHMLRHACGYKLANEGHDTRALQHYLSRKNIQHTVRYTDFGPDRFKNFWRD